MTASHVRQLFYATAAAIGLVLTWFFNLRYSGSAGYLADWFANDASSSVAVDLIVVAIVASVFMLSESRRVGIRLYVTLAFVLAGFLIAMACAFPLFSCCASGACRSRLPNRRRRSRRVTEPLLEFGRRNTRRPGDPGRRTRRRRSPGRMGSRSPVSTGWSA